MTSSRKRILTYLLWLISSGFILLSLIVLVLPVSLVDRVFSEEVQEHQYPVLDILMRGISWFGYMPVSLLMVCLTSALFYGFKYRTEALFVLLTLLSGLMSAGMKILINRPRPTEDLVRIVEKAQRQSFPSGHVLFYVVLFGFLSFLMYHLKSLPKVLRLVIGIASLFLIFTVPISRIYLGAHWFTDVLGGFFLGIICLYLLSAQYIKASKQKAKDIQ